MDRRLDQFRAALVSAARDYRYNVVRRREGRVLAVGDGVARVRGLEDVRLDELVTFHGGEPIEGQVLDLTANEAGVVLLGREEGVSVGSTVSATGRVLSVPVGESLLGRVLDPLGRPLDGGPEVDADAFWAAERPAPDIVSRQPVTEPLLTGLIVIDALFPIGRGQRELIIGDRGTGKSAIAIDTIIHQRDRGVRCVLVTIGQRTSSVVQAIEVLRRAGALAHTTVVVASSESPAGLRFLAPYAGCTMAEYFRDRGEDSLLVLDDLTRHAETYRELCLLLRRPPGREAYPGDVFYVHSRLLERATHLENSLGGGSLTILPIAETQAGRISDYIPTNLISITDGQLYLDATIFDRGSKPAVDVGLSVSRVGGKTQRPAMKAVAGSLRLDAARFREVEVFTRFGSRVEAETEKLLTRGARIRELLKQTPGALIPLGEQVAVLVALEEGLFDGLPLAHVPRARDRLREVLRQEAPELLRGFDHSRLPGSEERRMLRDAFARSLEEGGS